MEIAWLNNACFAMVYSVDVKNNLNNCSVIIKAPKITKDYKKLAMLNNVQKFIEINMFTTFLFTFTIDKKYQSF